MGLLSGIANAVGTFFGGPAIGGLASAVVGGLSSHKASQQANQGFDYMRNSPVVQQAQQQGAQAGGLQAALLGLGGDQAAADAAFKQYQGSTGYQFRLGQGMSAINENAAMKGTLNSGATLKALQGFGQNLASTEFSNYINQLQGVQGQGLTAAGAVGTAGTSSGAAAGGFTQDVGTNIMGGLGIAGGAMKMSDLFGAKVGSS